MLTMIGRRDKRTVIGGEGKPKFSAVSATEIFKKAGT
jgi:hypothetical protein